MPVGVGLAVRPVGVSDGEAMVVATVGVVGEGVNSVATGTGVGGVSRGKQAPKMMAIGARTGQILAMN